MFNSFKRWLFNCVREASHMERKEVRLENPAPYQSLGALLGNQTATISKGSQTNMPATKRVDILHALNGRIIEIYYRSNPNHDWSIELYIVRDDESLADAVAAALVCTGESK